jgi:CRP-like cAMP-binding protein
LPRLLRDLPDRDVQPVVDAARRRTFGKGEVVFHQGDFGDTLHLITNGRFAVRVTTAGGEAATLAVLGPGDVFGELALIRPDAVRIATVVALEPAQTLSLAREDFFLLRKEHPEVNEVLLTIVAEKVKRYTDQLLEALYLPAEMRVLRRLLELGEIYGDSVVPVRQEDLAGMAGTSRATVNRVLRQEADRGTVSLSRGRVGILDAARLQRRARLWLSSRD